MFSKGVEVMYIWLDDIRVPDSKYVWAKSVNGTKQIIENAEIDGITNFVLDLDHDLGDYAYDVGDAIKLVLCLIETGRNNGDYKIYLHTDNPVGRENMQSLIDRYWNKDI
jgi:hypothetical protein